MLGDIPDLERDERGNTGVIRGLTSQREDNTRVPSVIVVLTIRNLSFLKREVLISTLSAVSRKKGANVTAGAW